MSWGKGLPWEELRRSRPVLEKIASLAAQFILGFLGGSARFFGRCGPFGLALAGRCGSGPAGVSCVLGAALGYLLRGGASQGIRYVSALILIYTAAYVFRDTRLAAHSSFMSFVVAALTALTGALRFFDSFLLLETAVDLMAETLLAGLSTYFFTLALSGEQAETEQEEQRAFVGNVLLCCVGVMALCGVEIWSTISLGRLAAVFLVLVCAYGGGASVGCVGGLILGAAVDIAGGETPVFSMCYALAGLLAGLLCRRGRLLFLLCFVLADALGIFWNWTAVPGPGGLYEVFISSVIFQLLPSSCLTFLTGALRTVGMGSGEAALRRYTARRTRDLADAFRELYETVRQNVEDERNDNDIATVYDRAAEQVCADCRRKGECWHRDYMDTLSVLNDATEALRRRGRLLMDDLPPRFTERCDNADEFMDAVNAELRSMTFRRRLRARLEENRTAAYGQFRYLAGVLDAVADELKNSSGPVTLAERRLLRYLNSQDIDAEVSVFRDHSGRLRVILEGPRLAQLTANAAYLDKLSSLLSVRLCRPAAPGRESGRLVLMEAEPLSVSVGVAAVKKEGENVSGDRGTYFKTEQGVLCVLLSDGMGSGESAAQESVSTVRILERFLRAGVEPGTAMRILNSVMLLKNGENWGYATVDLMCIDLFTGEASFYKYGAAPSYVRNGRSVRRVKGISLAAGILSGEGEAPDVVRMELKPGGLAIIASDGVITRQSDGWLRELLLGYEGSDTRELARRVLREAMEQYGCSDDMTVLAVRVEERQG
ncbi:MAG: SpoIIE family protein phosphatase [Oscillospiraceae bacterium]|nr:SpoIIE family protein phosphatase [Oscillospiraceae bacterium]